MSVFPASGARGSKDLPFTLHFKNGKSLEPPSSTRGGDRHMRSGLFYTKFNSEQLLFEAFFDVMRIFGCVELQSEFTFPLQYIIIFKI